MEKIPFSHKVPGLGLARGPAEGPPHSSRSGRPPREAGSATGRPPRVYPRKPTERPVDGHAHHSPHRARPAPPARRRLRLQPSRATRHLVVPPGESRISSYASPPGSLLGARGPTRRRVLVTRDAYLAGPTRRGGPPSPGGAAASPAVLRPGAAPAFAGARPRAGARPPADRGRRGPYPAIEVLEYSPVPAREYMRPVVETTVDDVRAALEFASSGLHEGCCFTRIHR
jgi:hypothetical protein